MTGQQSPLNKTSTPVHSMDAMLRQRETALAHDQCVLSGVSLYGQIYIGIALYLYSHVSTPGYLSILLAAPFLLLVSLLSLWLARQADPRQGVLRWAAGRRAGSVMAVVLAAVFWLDAQLAVYSLTAIVQNVLPNVSTLWVSLAIAVMMAITIGGGEEHALPRLARMLRWLILAFFLYCLFTALPYGKMGHLFPLLGHGGGRLFQGALWICGCLGGACCPLILPNAGQYMGPLRSRTSLLLRPQLTALAAAILTALLSAYLLPVYALARPETLGWRLLLITHVSPSVVGWSLFLCAVMFLMLITLAAGVTQSASLLTWAAGAPRAKPYIIAVLLLLQVPAAALDLEVIEEGLTRIAPWRGAAVLLILLTLALGALVKKGRGTPEKENAQ